MRWGQGWGGSRWAALRVRRIRERHHRSQSHSGFPWWKRWGFSRAQQPLVSRVTAGSWQSSNTCFPSGPCSATQQPANRYGRHAAGWGLQMAFSCSAACAAHGSAARRRRGREGCPPLPCPHAFRCRLCNCAHWLARRWTPTSGPSYSSTCWQRLQRWRRRRERG
jgi:hypothetical protein